MEARTKTVGNYEEEQRCNKGNNESIIGNHLFNAKNGKRNEAESGQGSRNNKRGKSLPGGKKGVGEQRKKPEDRDTCRKWGSNGSCRRNYA